MTAHKDRLLKILIRGEVERFRDMDGRPLGEQRVPDLQATVGSTLRRCPYPGSRHHHALPMNVSALKPIMGSWVEIAGLLGHIRSPMFERLPGGLAPAHRLFALFFGASALPAYLLLRREHPVADLSLTPAVGGFYKVVIGAYATMLDAMLSGLELPASASGHLAHLDSRALLIGAREVCAGPPDLIEELFAVALGERPAAGRAFNVAKFDSHFDLEDFVSFAAAYTELVFAWSGFILATWAVPTEEGVVPSEVALALARAPKEEAEAKQTGFHLLQVRSFMRQAKISSHEALRRFCGGHPALRQLAKPSKALAAMPFEAPPISDGAIPHLRWDNLRPEEQRWVRQAWRAQLRQQLGWKQRFVPVLQAALADAQSALGLPDTRTPFSFQALEEATGALPSSRLGAFLEAAASAEAHGAARPGLQP